MKINRWKFVYLVWRETLRFTNCKRAGSVSLRNYRALFLRRNVGGGDAPVLHISLRFIPSLRKTWRRHCTRSFVLFRAMFFSCHGTIVYANCSLMLVVYLGNSDKTVTRWKYYFYLMHFFKILHTLFYISRHIAILANRKERLWHEEKYLFCRNKWHNDLPRFHIGFTLFCFAQIKKKWNSLS